MTAASPLEKLLRRVAWRQQVAAAGWRFQVAALGGGAIYLLGLLGGRLLAWWPEYFFGHVSFLAIPVLAFVVAGALLAWRRPARVRTARLLDRHEERQSDLFLTAVQLKGTRDDFAPLVHARAEAAALEIAPHRVLPYRFMAGGARVLGMLLLVWVAVLFTPRLDPFGHRQERQRLAERAKQLEETRRATTLRAAELQQPEQRHAEIEKALDDLSTTLKMAKPTEKEANLQRLTEDQKELGQLWRQLNEEKLKAALDSTAANQSFGERDPKKTAELKEQLQHGDTEGVRKELAQIKDQARRLAAMPASADQQKLRNELRQQLQTLADAVAKDARSPALNAALSRALEQMDLAGTADLAKQALASAEGSLQLSEQELSAVAQSMKDMKNLEDALKTTQLAKHMNDEGALDGGKAGDAKTLGDYADLFDKKMAGEGNGQVPGPGMKGPGLGKGGHAPEDASLKTAMQPEQSKSALTGGKLLLQWKTSELADSGQAREDYQRSLAQVKQGVSEAIIQEQIPPGYQQGIQKYFDSLGAPAH